MSDVRQTEIMLSTLRGRDFVDSPKECLINFFEANDFGDMWIWMAKFLNFFCKKSKPNNLFYFVGVRSNGKSFIESFI